MNQNGKVIGDYVIVSPVKDEERYLETTIKSVLAQTVRPAKWIIVDDGSTDCTPEIIRRHCRECDWIISVHNNRDAERRLGSAEVQAFLIGYEFLRKGNFSFIVKLDGDLDLSRDYFERMLQEFGNDPRLGIASGVYLENITGQWKAVDMPEYHAAGAAKMVRRECFDEIGGFPLLPGWDTVDEIKAHAAGWHTAHFKNIQMLHLKPEGCTKGWGIHGFHGEIYYVCGGGKLFFLFKVIQRMVTETPFILSGFLMLAGYLNALLSGRPRLVNREEARLYRSLLNKRLTSSVLSCFGFKARTEQSI